MAGAEQLHGLLDTLHEGPVFGEGVAFGELDSDQRTIIAEQTAFITADAAAAVTAELIPALPDYSGEDIATNVRQVMPKTGVAFASLAAGELTGPEREKDLSLVCQSGAYMYIMDQLTDRGDEIARLAIELHQGESPNIPDGSRELVFARGGLLRAMDRAITLSTGKNDANTAAVQDCFGERVLSNEVRLQRLSGQYARLNTVDRKRFLGIHGATIAELMVADAGYETVTTSLHGLYAKEDPALPQVTDILSNEYVSRSLQICNAVARVADERGDWKMDAGYYPEYGEFSINPFNEAHPAIINRLCELAGIQDEATIAGLTGLFTDFSRAENNEERAWLGNAITNRFFEEMRLTVNAMDDQLPPEFAKHTQLCRRVGEFSFINMQGDIALAGEIAA